MPFSRQAIKKYILANNKLAGTSDAQFNGHINRALTTGEETGVFERPKGESVLRLRNMFAFGMRLSSLLD